VHAIYAWCRALDETVDAAGDATECADTETLTLLEAKLDTWQRRLRQFWGAEADAEDQGNLRPEEIALSDTIRRVEGLEPQPFLDMVEGMRMDVSPAVRYHSWEPLYEYCYRVAGTVALMTIPVLGTAKGADQVGPCNAIVTIFDNNGIPY
jgi:phytoene synthase